MGQDNITIEANIFPAGYRKVGGIAQGIGNHGAELLHFGQLLEQAIDYVHFFCKPQTVVGQKVLQGGTSTYVTYYIKIEIQIEGFD
jgi:hypothetical protein